MSSSPRHYCTYFDRNYLAKGLALIASLARHEERDWVLHVVCLDELTRTVLDGLALPNVRTIPLHAIERGDAALVEPRKSRSLVEYYWTLTPTVILRVLEGLGEGEVLTYLDADLFFYASPAPIFQELGDASILIHEHRYSRSMAWLAENGRFNVGLLCFRHDARGLGALSWWRERCIEWCFKRCEGGKMGDQCYLDDWTERFPGVVVLQHVGAGLGPWNHDSYRFGRDARGQATVDDLPVVFYHFHSFTVVTPELFMPVGSAYHLTRPLLELVFAPYAEALREAIAVLQREVPGFAFGITHPGVSADQVLLATPSMAPVLEKLGVPHAQERLSPSWDIWGAKQLVDEASPLPSASSDHASRAPAVADRAPPASAPASSPRLDRAAVSALLERAGIRDTLVAALTSADHAIAQAFPGADPTTARALLLGLVATTLDGASRPERPLATSQDTAGADVDARACWLANAISEAAARDALDEADAHAAELARLLPEHPDVSVAQGHLAMRRGDLRKAQDRFLRASVLAQHADPAVAADVANAFVELAAQWHTSGQPDLARLDLGRAQRLVPGHAGARSLEARLSAPIEGRTPPPPKALSSSLASALAGQSAPVAGSTSNLRARIAAVAAKSRASEPESVRATDTARAATGVRPKVSVIVLCWNGLDVTKRCLDSVARHTSTEHEILVVDNGSTDGTPEYVTAWAERRTNARVVLVGENLGYAGGNNVGMAAARGEHLLILNNDTIVTPGWLEGMLAVLEQHPKTGLVGPRSNYVAGRQLVDDVGYRDDSGIDEFARGWARAHAGESRPNDALIGFCLLVRRELVDRIGGFDTRFGRGNYEDNDYCMRAEALGYERRIADGVFVHHEGHKTFEANGLDLAASLDANWKVLKAKWGADPELPRDVSESRLSPRPEALSAIPLPDLSAYRASHGGAVLSRGAGSSSSGVSPTGMESMMGRRAQDGAAAPDAAVTRRAALFDEGERLAAKGDWSRAYALFAELARESADFAPAFVGLASTALALGHVDEGLAALDRACELAPQDVALHARRGAILLQTGNVARARDCFRVLVARHPESVEARLGLAESHRLAKSPLEAVEVLDLAHRTFPSEPAFVAAIGTLAAELGDRSGAERALRALESFAPDHPRTAALRGTLGAASVAAW